MPKRMFSLIAVLCFLTPVVWSQETRGNIAGKVSDPSGASVAGAKVVVTNTAMGTKTNLTTNETGFYQATYLIPGVYQVEASAAGFQHRPCATISRSGSRTVWKST